MDYYNTKKKAFREIDELLNQGVHEDVIVWKITTKYGFGEKLIRDRISLTERTMEVTK